KVLWSIQTWWEPSCTLIASSPQSRKVRFRMMTLETPSISKPPPTMVAFEPNPMIVLFEATSFIPEGDGARRLDHPGAGRLHLGYQLRTVRHGHGRSAGATGGGAVHGGPADQAGLAAATTATVIPAPDPDELELLVEAVQVGELRDPATVGGRPL